MDRNILHSEHDHVLFLQDEIEESAYQDWYIQSHDDLAGDCYDRWEAADGIPEWFGGYDNIPKYVIPENVES